MTKTQEIKLMIIENFIDHFTSSKIEREIMKDVAKGYVEEDHVDEIEQAGFKPFDIKVKHLLDENEKISTFNTESEFLKFVHQILAENFDAENFVISNVQEGKDYISEYCDNLQLVI